MSSYSGIFLILCSCLIMLHSIPLLISFHSVQGDPGWEWAGPKLPRGPGTNCPAPGCVRGIRLTSMSVQSVSSSLGSHNTPGWTSLHFTVMACSLVLRPSAVVCKSLVSKSTVVIQHWPIRTSQMTSPQFWLVIFRFSSSVRWQMTCKPRYEARCLVRTSLMSCSTMVSNGCQRVETEMLRSTASFRTYSACKCQ